MVQRLDITGLNGKTSSYSHYNFSELLDIIIDYPGLPNTKNFSVKVTEEEEYIKLCTLCDEQDLDKASIELVEPVLNF
jgi:hypothetical protein